MNTHIKDSAVVSLQYFPHHTLLLWNTLCSPVSQGTERQIVPVKYMHTVEKELRCLGNSYSPPWHQLIPHLLLCQPLGFALQTHRAGRAVGTAAADTEQEENIQDLLQEKLVPCSACNEGVSGSTGSRSTIKLFFRKDGLWEKRLLVAAETSTCLSTSTPDLKSSVARKAAGS